MAALFDQSQQINLNALAYQDLIFLRDNEVRSTLVVYSGGFKVNSSLLMRILTPVKLHTKPAGNHDITL